MGKITSLTSVPPCWMALCHLPIRSVFRRGWPHLPPVDNLNAFWALYAPTTEENSRGLMAEICSALGLAEPLRREPIFPEKVIADKIERYLSQHPYVRAIPEHFQPRGRIGDSGGPDIAPAET